jgi:hypothetical protein
MKNIPAARRREVLTRTKGKLKAKNEILEEVIKWIQLGKDTKAIEECVLSLDYNDMQIATAQDEIRQLFLSDYSKTSKLFMRRSIIGYYWDGNAISWTIYKKSNGATIMRK